MSLRQDRWDREWLETDGLGGFASGTVSGIRTRRYHALLLTAATPPTGRFVLVNGLEVWIDGPGGRTSLSAQRYAPDAVYPDGHTRIVEFGSEPWPTWRFRTAAGVEIVQEVLVRHGTGDVLLEWSTVPGTGPIELKVRPLLSGRDYHSLHRENPAFRFESEVTGPSVIWRPYQGLPAIQAISNGRFDYSPDWYRNFLFTEEQNRGLDCVEDLASPGVFTWRLDLGKAVLLLRAVYDGNVEPPGGAAPLALAWDMRTQETQRRAALGTQLDRSADAYIVQRGRGRTIVAGYPWFTDWGRDTFIAMRGLCIARGDLTTAGDILLEWAGAVSEGMLPNRFPDGAEQPEYNSVDASLWYIIAVHDYFEAARRETMPLPPATVKELHDACRAIVEGYARGTRFGIHMDADGLLAAGVSGVQLTWMDAKIGDWVVTPRIGKPVEIQALWYNALQIVSEWASDWRRVTEQCLAAFRRRFPRPDGRGLCDVVDVDHASGPLDAACRPNQIFAVGGLPFPLLTGAEAAAVVDEVESQLLTPLGLRSLAPGEVGYRPRYEGGVFERDSAYHQGTVWPWLIGPFVEAWLRVRGDSTTARGEAVNRFVRPLREHLGIAGIGHVSEIVDADAPHTPRGCPFQAWSLGELIRVETLLGRLPDQHSVDPAAAARRKKPSRVVGVAGRDRSSR